MKDYFIRTTLLVTVAVAFTVYANAAVITVSPERMRGWVIVTNKEARAELVTYGPAVYEREKAFIADDGTDLGRGAYYARIGFEAGTTPPSTTRTILSWRSLIRSRYGIGRSRRRSKSRTRPAHS